MASDYTLKLKATLDTSQVLNELLKLRTQLKLILGGSVSGSIQGGTNLNNVSGINGTLNRLILSINNLDKTLASILHINKQSVKNIDTSGLRNNSNISPLALSSRSANASTIGSSMTLYDNKALRTFFRRIAAGEMGGDKAATRAIAAEIYDPMSKLGNQLNKIWLLGITPLANKEAALNFANNVRYKEIAKIGTIASFARSERGKEYINYNPELEERIANNKEYKRIGRIIGGMMFNLVVPSITDYLSTTDWGLSESGLKTLHYFNNAGKIASYASMGAIAGPYGAAAGALIGTIESIFDSLTKNAKEAEEELNRIYDKEVGLKKGTTSWIRNLETYREDKRFNDILGNDDENRLKYEQDFLLSDKKRIEKNIARFEKMREGGFLGDSDLQNANDALKELQTIDGKLKSIESKLEAYENKRKVEKKQVEAYDDLISKAFLGLSQYDTNRANNHIISTGKITDILSGYNDWKSKAGTARIAYEVALKNAQNILDPEQKKKAIDKANDLRSLWVFNQQLSDVFKSGLISNLQNILGSLKAPDMANVNSLASQGLMISARDDEMRIKEQTDYLKQLTKLQQEIKDLIKEDGVNSYQ